MQLFSRDLKSKLRSRKQMFAGWISFDHPSIAELMAQAGFDFIGLDMEHAPISLSSAQRLIAASQAFGVPCLPRPSSHSNDLIKPLLDSGANGLLAPLVASRDAVNDLAAKMYYPPEGLRTFGVNRAHLYGLDFLGYHQHWNENCCFISQIETKEAIQCIDEIVSHPLLDGVMIGPYDLSGSLGVAGQTDHPLVLEASRKVVDACFKHGKSCGTQIANPSHQAVENAFSHGYSYVILGSDLFAMAAWTSDMQDLIRVYN